ncbi:MAG: hypothetical protein ACYDH9_26435 [Limisphaerales bacterium]
MPSSEQSKNVSSDPVEPPGSRGGHRHAHSGHRPRTPKAYDVCDWLTEGVLYFMILFGPWAFGTTQVWSTWVMNVAAYALGATLITKWTIRWRAGYQPVRWGQASGAGGSRMADGRERSAGLDQTSEVGSQKAEEGRGQRGEVGSSEKNR